MIEIYVDHCAEEKGTNIVDGMNFIDDGIEIENPDYEEEEYTESDQSKGESDTDEELEEIKDKKGILKEGLIDPSRDSNLTNMDVENVWKKIENVVVHDDDVKCDNDRDNIEYVNVVDSDGEEFFVSEQLDEEEKLHENRGHKVHNEFNSPTQLVSDTLPVSPIGHSCCDPQFLTSRESIYMDKFVIRTKRPRSPCSVNKKFWCEIRGKGQDRLGVKCLCSNSKCTYRRKNKHRVQFRGTNLRLGASNSNC
ncbi:hypothetical protein ACET3Z_001282 [Daucus carota]